MEQTRLSIVTPTKNQLRYLRQCLANVRRLGPEVEHIVVDGASRDGSTELLEEWARQNAARFRFVSRPDRSMYEAVETGMALARSQFVGYLPCDDLLMPWTADVVLDAFADDVRAEMVVGDAVVWDEPSGRAFMVVPPAGALVRHFLLCGGHLPQPAVFFRRSLWRRLGGFDASYRLLGDHDLFVRAARDGVRVTRVHEVLALMRASPDQLMVKHAASVPAERRRVHGRLSSTARACARFAYAAHHRLGAAALWAAGYRGAGWYRYTAASGIVRMRSLRALVRATVASTRAHTYLEVDASLVEELWRRAEG